MIEIIEELTSSIRKFQYAEDYGLNKPSTDEIYEMASAINRLIAAKEEEIAAFNNMTYASEGSFSCLSIPDLLYSARSRAYAEMEMLESLRAIINSIEY